MYFLRLSLVLGLILALAPTTQAQTLAWGEAAGELWTLSLPDGEMNPVGPTGVAPGLSALARTSDDRLFGLDDPGPASELYELDTTSGAASLVVTLDLSGADGLAVLDDGRVFVNVGADIYELNPVDGSTTLLASLVDTVTALGDDGATLLALVDSPTDPQMFRVDPADGDTTLINDSMELRGGHLGIAVDSDGSVWTLSRGGGIISSVSFVPQRIHEFGAGDIVTHDTFGFHFTEPQAGLSSLALRGAVPPVAVPGASPAGQTLLTLLLVAAGWLVLIRRG